MQEDRGSPERDGRRPARRRLLKGIAALAVGTAGYAAFVPPRRVAVNRYRVPLAGLPAELHGLRVAHLTDLHFGPFFRTGATRRMVALANAFAPHLVVLTGDFVSYWSLRFVHSGARELPGLRAPLGVFACLGNHDYWEDADAVRRALEANGVRVLMNESIEVAGGLRLSGVDDLMSGNPDLAGALADVPAGAATVLLSHNPTVLPEVAHLPLLVLSGHTHGGQVALPFLGARKTAHVRGINTIFRHYEALGARLHGGRVETVATHRYPCGWYQHGRARAYVNRGIGVGQDFPFRLNCLPEIACLTLVPAQVTGVR